MATAAHVSLDQYLNTGYEPDCEYIEGLLEGRHGGKKKHSRTQALLAKWLGAPEDELGHELLIEQRVRLSASRFRIPDLCLVPAGSDDEVTQQPPSLWVEILSPEDRWSRVQSKLRDVLEFGVPTVWIIDPYSNQAWIATVEQSVTEVGDGLLRCTNLGLEVPLSAVLPKA